MDLHLEEWNAAAERLAELSPQQRKKSPDFGKLYQLSLKLGPRLLVGKGIDAERAHGIVADVLLQSLDEIVTAKIPLPYFNQCVKNAGRDWLAKKSSFVAEAAANDEPSKNYEEDITAALDVKVVWLRLLPKEREIFAALQAGEDRDAVAAALGTTRTNIDQLISRARKRLKAEGLP